MRFRFVTLVIPFAAALAFGACNGESEGQPCDRNAGNNGNDDCQSPLVCTPGLARCCPVDRTQATTPECSLNSSTSDASPAPPDSNAGDGPTGEAATGDGAAGDAKGDASGDGGTTSDGSAAEGAAGEGGGDGASSEAATD
jgi:hypothetical protein